MSEFLKDVLKGLSSKEKFLYSKYFYNEEGDRLFQKIMQLPEYYLTRCELEIFTQQTEEIASALIERSNDFDVIELGPGDATKSIHLLKKLTGEHIDFTYYPVDISANVIGNLQQELPKKIPAIKVHGLNGEYLAMLQKVKASSSKPKVVLFLGSNIGNVPLEDAVKFCSSIRQHLQSGDMLLIGFDLKKDPQLILKAYNDKEGVTRSFNLNLLKRINDELGFDFEPASFDHYPTYDPATGACKSYLVSRTKQEVHLNGDSFLFEEGEAIHTEISQKYSIEEADQLAVSSGFVTARHFFDSKRWFLDSLWVAN
jgi:L-histidine N-alpha-methyltransferase